MTGTCPSSHAPGTVWDQWTLSWTNNTHFQNLWCSWAVLLEHESRHGMRFGYVAHVRADLPALFEEAWFVQSDKWTILEAADTIVERRQAALTWRDCVEPAKKFLGGVSSGVFFMGEREPMALFLAATRNVTGHPERHRTIIAFENNLTIVPVVAGAVKEQCAPCQLNMFLSAQGIACSRGGGGASTQGTLTCAMGEVSRAALNMATPSAGSLTMPHMPYDRFNVTPPVLSCREVPHGHLRNWF